MEFQYRGHTITIRDKVVECFTGMVKSTVTERLFDIYVDIAYRQEGQEFEDIDLSQISDEELSKVMEDSMLEECQVCSEVQGAWEKEIVKIREEEAANGVGMQEGGE